MAGRDHDYPDDHYAEPQRKPHRVPRPSSRARHPIVIVGNAIFTILLLLAIGVGGGILYGSHQFSATGPLEADRIVNIPPRTGLRDMADLLKREGVIDNPTFFVAGAYLLGSHDKLKAGEYSFEKGSSMSDVLETIVSGKSIQHSVTIAEGLTTQQIIQRLNEADVLSGPIQRVPPEGSLLPETYRVTRGTSREQLLQRMAAAHKKLVDEIWARRAPDLPVKDINEFVTLASIVEKETAVPTERARVASVFINRLNKKMRLQSDPTIIYGIVGGKGSLGRPISRADINQSTPYNTYTIDGLPPGPIGNPGRASLEAVANPARTNDLYFVADGTGGHVFAETLKEHNENVGRWREFEKQNAQRFQPASAPQTPSAQPKSPSSVPTFQGGEVKKQDEKSSAKKKDEKSAKNKKQ